MERRRSQTARAARRGDQPARAAPHPNITNHAEGRKTSADHLASAAKPMATPSATVRRRLGASAHNSEA